MKTQNLITSAIALVGLVSLAKACGVTYQAVRKWEKQGHLPITEWAGLTDHAGSIEKATEGEITKAQLLDIRPKKAA